MRNGKRAKSFLPGKMTAKPSLFIDMVARAGFYTANQVRQCLVGFHSDKNMCVIRHAINRDQFLLTSRHDPGDVFLQFFFVIGPNNAGTPRNCENGVDIDL
jgi:hypothetical protein